MPTALMSESQAEDYHCSQVETFVGTAVDLVTAITMNYAAEPIGVARAAQKAALPVVISLTGETDGRQLIGAIQNSKHSTGQLSCISHDEHTGSGYRSDVIGLSVVFAAALKRDAGVTVLAEQRLLKPAIVCSHNSADRFRRSRIGGTFLATDPRLPGFT